MNWQKVIADIMDDNTLIIVAVTILALSTDAPDIAKYVTGGLIGYLKASVAKERVPTPTLKE